MATNPEDAAELLQVVSEALAEYKEACMEYRNYIAANAFNMLGSKKKPKTVPEGIDTAFAFYPRGPEMSMSLNEREWWDAFSDLAEGFNDMGFIRDVKGESYYQWWQKVFGDDNV